MAIIKCKMCGGDLNIVEGCSTAECEFCGSVQTIPNLDDEKKLIQFERAERLRKQCEFDKAAGIYETIVADFRQEAEAYWGLVLCKYGIEYVDDPATGKKIPTCHRSSFDSILEDSDFEQALENADVMARRVYRDEAKTIEEIRKGIIEVSSKEEPYDIFICYKETAEDGDRTLDSVLAQDVYDALTEKGYRVFFSRITLEDKLGVEYEPYIFAALNSAKIMLVFGTDYEYFNAVWVKNEWSRFLKLMAKDKEKHLIPCYKGIDAYDMPKEFAKLQAQDLGKVGATQDLLRGIAKILSPQVNAVVAPKMPTSNVSAMVTRGQFALDDGDWAKADEYFERALDENPEEAKAYVGKVLVGLRLSAVEQINDYLVKLEGDKNFERAIRFSTGADKMQLEAIKEQAAKKWLVKCFTVGLKKLVQQKQAEEKRIALEKQAEEERLAAEGNKQRLLQIRQKIQPVQGILSAGACHTVGLKASGAVVAVGDNDYGQCKATAWKDIVTISAGGRHTVGLKADGTVVAVGDNDDGPCDVSKWKDIVAISAGDYHTVGLKTDGTVVAVGYNKYGQCAVANWKDIIAISAGDHHTVGLKTDGTVVAVGDNEYGQCKVANWKDIVAISAGDDHTVGLKADGTVVAVGGGCTVDRKADGTYVTVRSDQQGRKCDVAAWKDIVAISAGGSHTVGLKADGTVVAVGYNDCDQCNVANWKDLVAISAGSCYTVGLKASGAVVAVGNNDYGRCNVASWRLFKNFDNLEQEKKEERIREEAERLAIERRAAELVEAKRQRKIEEERIREEAERRAMQQRVWRTAYRCQHCGGDFRGFFSKKCVSCGKPKDY